jgi:hypothetical protein
MDPAELEKKLRDSLENREKPTKEEIAIENCEILVRIGDILLGLEAKTFGQLLGDILLGKTFGQLLTVEATLKRCFRSADDTRSFKAEELLPIGEQMKTISDRLNADRSDSLQVHYATNPSQEFSVTINRQQGDAVTEAVALVKYMQEITRTEIVFGKISFAEKTLRTFEYVF